MQGLLKNTKIVRHNAGAVAGTSTITPSAGIDMQGFKSCMFIVSIGAVTATGVPSIKVQESSDDSTYADLTGTAYAVTDTDDDKNICVEILNPGKRYLKCLVLRTTANCVLDGITAVLGNPQSVPVTQLSLGNEIFNTPVAGTA